MPDESDEYDEELKNGQENSDHRYFEISHSLDSHSIIVSKTVEDGKNFSKKILKIPKKLPESPITL